MKIAFFGTPKIAAIILESLIKTKFKPQLVITGRDKQSGRSLALKASAVKLVAKKHNIAISYKMSDIDKTFDLAILVAYGHIIPNEILRLPKFGFINSHPSLLPKYRGPSPIISAILNGDKTTGATIIVLDSNLDHGPIIAQGELPISETDTHDSLAQKLAKLGSKLIIETLPDYLDQNITPQAQDNEQAIYTEKITKQNGKIDLENPPDPQTLDRMIRAYYPWPTVWTEIETRDTKNATRKIRIKLLPPTIQPSNHPIDPFLIQPEGKKPMTIKEFLNGYPQHKELIGKILPSLNH